jgi:hypothetical protein
VSCSVTARCTPGRVPKGGGDGRSQGGESLTRVKATDCIGPGAPGLSGAALLVPRADRQRVSRRAESHRLAIGTTHALCPGTPPVRPASLQRRSARYAQPWALSFSDSEAHLSAGLRVGQDLRWSLKVSVQRGPGILRRAGLLARQGAPGPWLRSGFPSAASRRRSQAGEVYGDADSDANMLLCAPRSTFLPR